jgi:hypothetical protein
MTSKTAPMTAATKAPTEAELRAAVRHHLETVHEESNAQSLQDEVDDQLWAAAGALDAIWQQEDFRPSEQKAYDRLVDEAIQPLRNRLLRELPEAIIGIGLRFAAEHPDAPRAVAS